MSTLLSAMHARADAFTALRRDIHQHPEIGFKEFRTSDLVAERLQRLGYEVTRGLGGTGVVGQLKRGSGTRRLGLRADMDALPIHETTGLPYASNYAGTIHYSVSQQAPRQPFTGSGTLCVVRFFAKNTPRLIGRSERNLHNGKMLNQNKDKQINH